MTAEESCLVILYHPRCLICRYEPPWSLLSPSNAVEYARPEGWEFDQELGEWMCPECASKERGENEHTVIKTALRGDQNPPAVDAIVVPDCDSEEMERCGKPTARPVFHTYI